MKKIISAALAAAVTISSTSAFAAFTDVSEYTAAYTAINELEQLKIIDGDENGNFNPQQKLTRAEFAKLVVMALGEEDVARALTSTSFEDCAGHWAAGYIETGVADGFINGYSDTEFGPDDVLTYAQAVKMLVTAIGYSLYADNQGGWPAGYLTQGARLGITARVSASNDTALTREAAAVLIDNTIKIPLCVAAHTYGTTTYSIKDGREGRDYETLLTDRHDAYIVNGKVTETRSMNKGLGKDEVTYQVEMSDNFDGKAYNKTAEPVRMNVGSTDAKELLFYYTEAIVQKDRTTDEYKILTITAK